MKKKWLWILCALAVLGGCLGALVLGNEFTLEVRLSGENAMVLEYGESYREPGASALLRGTMFLKKGTEPEDVQWTVTQLPETLPLGEHIIEYTARYGDSRAAAQRKITVVDTTPPVITLEPDGPLEEGKAYVEAGFTALDAHDGDITDRVYRSESLGLVVYSVVDEAGNAAFAERVIPKFDGTPPEILLEGGERLTVFAGEPFVDPGWQAADNYDGDLTSQVQAEGEVCWYLRGSYPITYTLRDSFGNETIAERIVEVVPKPQPEVEKPKAKTIYLTFDDGPGPYTRQLLDLLDKYDVKATFFVTDTGYPELLKEMADRGHSIGIHTVSHNYESIYASVEAYFADLFRMQKIISDAAGVETTLMRFPGGSSNTVSVKICEGIMTTLTQAVRDAGFQYFDWNIDSNDAGGARKASEVFRNVKEGILSQGGGIVLQHDIHPYSVEAMEDILTWALDNGYRFEALTPNSPGYHHPVNN